MDGLGQTALHRVAQQGNMQACRLLIQYGVDPSIVSLQGYTAAQLATDNVQKMLRGKNMKKAGQFYMHVGGLVPLQSLTSTWFPHGLEVLKSA